VNEDLSIAFTKQELIDKAQQWVRDNSFGCSKDWHFTTLGCLVDFITDLYEPKPNPPPSLEHVVGPVFRTHPKT
jgi:hypothetical protein